MKTLSSFFLLLLVFSIDFGNTRLATEAKTCEAEPFPVSYDCTQHLVQCVGHCKLNYGIDADGHCQGKENCVCDYPC
ncbi:hypothetical protein L6164_016853 [Bauhinia variegata]|uniref:Uncharacterized protein n=1 Tax=Bauhinia variegata TaxID=167791 RepID=A0ACB9N6T7_BAUVA|nr:hypothetical protein L6164_016853 [Bauhinia variegata]